MNSPKLRDNKRRKGNEVYSLGEIPKNVITEIGKWIAYSFAIGKSDISGEDWGDIFSKSIDGDHLNSPLGLADVVKDGMAWSVKSVKHDHPHKCNKIRVISGRCSPDFSYGINNPHEDILSTGRAVLGIWNERVNIAKDHYEPLRSSVLIRNPNTLEFTIYEHEVGRFNTKEYSWETNKNGNFVGKRNTDQKHVFTWQPHGSQFTIIYDVPISSIRFRVRRPPVLYFNKTLDQIGFNSSWIEIVE